MPIHANSSGDEPGFESQRMRPEILESALYGTHGGQDGALKQIKMHGDIFYGKDGALGIVHKVSIMWKAIFFIGGILFLVIGGVINHYIEHFMGK